MRRVTLGLAVVAVGAVLGGFALALARPDFVPPWARISRPAADETADFGLFCKEHGVPEKFCTLCHQELRDKLMLCKEHGSIPEEICTLCHPEVQKKYRIEMCPNAHGLPKYFCMRCGDVPATSTDAPDDGWCAEHNRPEALCAECLVKGTEAKTQAPRVCRQPLPLVRLASAKLVKQIGLKTVLVTREWHSHRMRANAETAYDGNHYAEICPRVGGFLQDIRADLGQAIRLGDLLAVVNSAEVGSAKAQYLTALAEVELAEVLYKSADGLVKQSIVGSRRGVEARLVRDRARADLLNAEQRLRNLGFSESTLARVAKSRETEGLLNVLSPIAGVVVARHAVRGEAVQATSQLFAVADTTRTWLWVDVYERDISSLSLGQAVSFTVSGSDAVHSGRVTWIGTEVHPRTRTTRVRAELENRDGRLRANQFGRAEIQIDAEHEAVLVPKAAIQRKDNADLVFLRDQECTYRPQRVVTKAIGRVDVVEVTWGLKPGQEVVTEGAFLLKTEITKGAIGAGCCD